MRIAAPVPLLFILACPGDPETTSGGTTDATSTTTTADTTASAPTSDGPTTAGPTSDGPTTAGPTSDGPTTIDTTSTTSTSETSDPTATAGESTTSDPTATDDTTSTTGEQLPCRDGDEQPCFTGDPAQQDVGACQPGVSTCDDMGMWGDCVGEVLPAPESCETPGDEDCDGADPCMGDGNYKWHKFWGAGSDERGVRIVFDSTGALILAAQGASTSDFGGGPLPSAGSWDLYLAKFAPDGAHLWSKRFGDSGPQFGDGWALALAPGDEFVVAGGYQGNIDLGGGPLHSQSISDIFLARFTGDGEHVWSKTFKAGSIGEPEGLGVDADGEVYLSGSFTSTLDLGGGQMVAPGNTRDVFVGKFTAGGAHVWSQRFGDNKNQYGLGLTVDGPGNATIGGHFEGVINPGNGQLVSAGSDDAFIARFDPIGNAVWAKRFGDTNYQQLLTLTRSPGGRVTVTGRFEGAVDFGGGPLLAPNVRGFVAQFDPDGAHVWSKLLADGQAQPQGVAADGLGSLVLTGFFNGASDFGGGPLVSEGDHDIFAVKLTPSGAHVWSRRFGDNAAQEGMGVAADQNGTTAITGGFYGSVNFGGGPANTKGGYDGFLAVFDP